jgi:hypothetical protein
MSAVAATRAAAVAEPVFALLNDCRALFPQLEAAATDPEPVSAQSERLLYSTLVGTIEAGLVRTRGGCADGAACACGSSGAAACGAGGGRAGDGGCRDTEGHGPSKQRQREAGDPEASHSRLVQHPVEDRNVPQVQAVRDPPYPDEARFFQDEPGHSWRRGNQCRDQGCRREAREEVRALVQELRGGRGSRVGEDEQGGCRWGKTRSVST